MGIESDWKEWRRFAYGDPDQAELEQLAERGRQFGITAWDDAIFEAIWYDSGYIRDEESLAQVAFGFHRHDLPEVSEAAIQRCFDLGWIQVLDACFIRRMSTELATLGYLMPNGLFGLVGDEVDEQCLGLISFTESGVEFLKRWIAYDTDCHWALTQNRDAGVWMAYGVTLEACEDAMWDHLNQGEVIRHSTDRIGRWSDRWWNRFESGYCICFTAVERELSNAD
jgi:hypothetical protein